MLGEKEEEERLRDSARGRGGVACRERLRGLRGGGAGDGEGRREGGKKRSGGTVRAQLIGGVVGRRGMWCRLSVIE